LTTSKSLILLIFQGRFLSFCFVEQGVLFFYFGADIEGPFFLA